MTFTCTLFVLAIALSAAFTDIRSRRVPNSLIAVALPAGFLLNAVLSGMQGVKLAAAGFGLAFGVYFMLYLLRAMGAGDVKLMAAIGALTGPSIWLAIFFFSAVAGGFIALLILITHRRVRHTFFNVSIALSELMHFRAPYLATEELDVRSSKALRLPHAVSIALGTMCFVVVRYLPMAH